MNQDSGELELSEVVAPDWRQGAAHNLSDEAV